VIYQPASPNNLVIAIFKAGQVRGVKSTYTTTGGKTFFNATYRDNASSNTGFNIQVYDPSNNTVYDIAETIDFTALTNVGTTSAPIRINIKFAIAATSSDDIKGSVSGTTGSFTSGQSVSLTATPTTDNHFVNWTDGVGGTVMSTDATYTFNASENRNLIANFESGQVTNINEVQDLKIGVFPNPISNCFELSFNSPTYTYSSVEIYDLRGLLVKQVFSGFFVGDKVIAVERDNSFSTGLYILKVKNGTSQSARKILFQ